jgi:hypothetical protein
MNMRFLHPSAADDAAAEHKGPGGPAVELITEPSALVVSACCCPARPAVRVIMPPGPARPRSTELLLCGHHYRVSRAALSAARAVVYELPDTPEDIASWVAVERAGTAASLG